jgi:hypothetical protein
MSRQFLIRSSLGWLALCVAAVGCRPQQPFYFFEHKDMSHYVDVATTLEYPDVQNPTLDDVQKSLPPLTLENPDPGKMWDLSLEDAMKIALENSKVIRSLGGQTTAEQSGEGAQPLAVASRLLSGPDGATTTHNPAITETDGRFGVEAALAAYDAQLTASMDCEQHHTPLNVNANLAPALYVNVNEQEVANFQAAIQKTYMTGGTWSLTNNIDYLQSNNPVQLFNSAYTVNFEAAVRQPLLQGAGVQFNEIAGPQAIPGFYNGVRIARLRTDISLADFEAQVRGLVSDVERAYWELYFSYHQLDIAVKGRNEALEDIRKERKGEDPAYVRDRKQAQYFQFRAQTEEALTSLYRAENALRYVMGLAATDGRLIRPCDQPTLAKVNFDWCECLTEALCRSVELRQQKWRIKQRELELIASKNFLLPRLDGLALYRWIGLGNKLDDPSNTQSNAFGDLIDGAHQEWQLELQLQLPIGFRKEMSGVRNAQLTLARERAILQEQELELSHLLAANMRNLAESYKTAQTNFNEYLYTEQEYESLEKRQPGATESLAEFKADARLRRTQAEIAYYRSVVSYNDAISGVHFRKGSLLEYNGVYLAEGPWPRKAYFDAQRRARARDAALYFNYGFTQPRVQSRGPIQQSMGGSGMSGAPMPPAAMPPAAMPLDTEAIPPGVPVEKPLEDRQPKSILPGGETGAWLGPQGAGQMDSPLDPRWGSPSGAGALQPGAVQPAAYQETQGSGGVVVPEARDGPWKSSQPGGNGNESVAHLPAVETDRSAPGWKGS